MTFAMIVNQKLLATLAISSCVVASALALLETDEQSSSSASHSISSLSTIDDGLNARPSPTNTEHAPTEETAAAPRIPLVANAKAVCLQVWPKSISLTHAHDRQSIVAQLVYSNGVDRRRNRSRSVNFR